MSDASSQVAPSLFSTMSASCLSGMLSRIPCHPMDTAKARLQATKSSGTAIKTPSVIGTIASAYKTNGLRGVYAGFNMAFFGSAPGTVLYFTSYELAKKKLNHLFFPGGRQPTDFQSNAINFTSGLLAETISCVVWVPIDVVKERLQVQSLVFDRHGNPLPHVQNTGAKRLTYYKSTIHALQTIAKTEGIRGIYKGYGATLASFGPFSAIYLSSYEWFRKTTLAKIDYTSEKGDPPPWVFLTSGTAAALLASVLTNPFDLIRLRIQIQRASANQSRNQSSMIGNSGLRSAAMVEQPFSYNYKNLVHGLYTAVKTEGIQVLMKGVVARACFTIPNTAITVSLFDYLRTQIQKIEKR